VVFNNSPSLGRKFFNYFGAACFFVFIQAAHLPGQANEPPVFDFEFQRTSDAREWMMVLRIRFGTSRKVVETKEASATQVIFISSFDEGDHALLNESTVVSKPREYFSKRSEPERVKARGKSR
jgi:hypothetical protein